ncbi:MAG: META domain-containing protein [Alphaproteobacteria bacterium]|nr:META domain-containing protein [Alphaproteobacteria bacterium]
MARRTLTAAMAMLSICIGLAGCESAVSDGDQSEGLTRLDWVAETIIGQAVIQPGRVTLAFAEGRVSGRGGCNIYSGPVEIRAGTLAVGALISTKMACMDAGLAQQERVYLDALQSAQRYSLGGGGKLTITTAAGALVYHGEPKQQRPEGS